MKNFLPKTAAVMALMTSLSFSTFNADAAWEQVHSLPVTYAHYVTSEGLHLMSDYRDNRDGGIYYSEDRGQTWTKSEVKDYWYSNFYEADGYVFAIGCGCRIARSEDGGRTWDLLNYSRAVKDWIPEKALDETVCYGITVLDGVLYVGDFSGGGVLSSSDYGETWEMTDRESMYIHFAGDPTDVMDNVYHLEAFKGKVYSFGMYSVHSYSPETKKWTALPINSNFMGSVTVMGDIMVCGRAVPNYGYDVEYLLATDGENWGAVERPDTEDNNVRALNNDGTFLFSMHHGGPMYYTDNMGASWEIADGLPEGLYPLTVYFDDEYVYSALYTPIPSETKSGLWRLAKSELKSSGVDEVTPDNASAPYIAEGAIICGATSEVTVFSISGSKVLHLEGVSRVNLELLPEGQYVYEVVTGDCRFTGKFMK